MKDLDYTIRRLQTVVEETPEGHHEQAKLLGYLAVCSMF